MSVTPTLTDEQAKGVVLVLDLVRAELILSSTRLAGASLADLRGAQSSIEDALKRAYRSKTPLAEPSPYERATWSPDASLIPAAGGGRC